MLSTTFGVQPSATAIRRAAEMGREMARRERNCMPDVSSAVHYESYIRFRNAERDRMEHTEEFSQHWLEQLFRIAEREGKSAGLRMDDSMASWDTWYNSLVAPLKEIFWHAWESTWDLPAQYASARQAITDTVTAPVVLRVAHAGTSETPGPREGVAAERLGN